MEEFFLLAGPANRESACWSEEPCYPSDGVRRLSLELEAAYERKLELEAIGEDTTAVASEILALKRRLREGGQLQAGDLLVDRFKLIEVIGRKRRLGHFPKRGLETRSGSPARVS